MVSTNECDAQLKGLGITAKMWGRSDRRELPNILMSGEQITGLVTGWYEHGFATLVATNHRLLLVDKRLLFLTVEDVRYDMIAEVDYSAGALFSARVSVTTVNKTLRFTSIAQKRLREMTMFVQRRVMEIRQQHQQIPVDQQQAQTVPQEATTAYNAVPATQPGSTAMPVAQQSSTTLPATQALNPLPILNPYARVSLTTRHYFLPKIRRPLRPTPTSSNSLNTSGISYK